eukprot:CAMPEP_0115864850 /NCGR_PEP_ID=MMETSP0287-20121206/19415_1 /TAXON_ID=412157 /ORGANISM="Chrysochromulina rotalis, Strain UIO044" /LENGTH=690 /DNA_ID=CAMNT_0003319337 /DNA_START=42 /DNA_END=2114 /DNA_ORIENTATION=-
MTQPPDIVYANALALSPSQADAYNDLGAALATHGAAREREAATAYLQAIHLAPRHGIAYNNLAALLARSPRSRGKAMHFYTIAHALQPHQYDRYPQMHLNLAAVLVDAARYDEAIWHYGRGVSYEPHAEDTLGRLVHLSQRVCNWRAVERIWPRILHVLYRVQRRGPRGMMRPAISPMHALTFPISAHQLLLLATVHSAVIEADVASRRQGFPRDLHISHQAIGGSAACGINDSRRSERRESRCTSRARFRIGIISFDFKRHPVAILMAPALAVIRQVCKDVDLTLFALNQMVPPTGDATVQAISATPSLPRSEADESLWSARLHSASHRVVQLHNVSDEAAATQIHASDLHLLLDLNGLFSRGARPRILAMRPTPLQATHLGYGASTGARFMDFVIGDSLVLPVSSSHAALYAEKFMLLPASHLPTGHAELYPHLLRGSVSRPEAHDHPGECAQHGRARYGLPRHGVVLGFFGQHLKIDEQTFSRWLSMLTLLPGSVLWMLRWPSSTDKLVRQAAAAGVRTSRLIFTDRLPQAEHLCAFQLADLALDAPRYSSGATGIDVLWSGVPMLAMAGGMQPGGKPLQRESGRANAASTNIFQRNAVSLVTAAAQPHLQSHSSAGYVELGLGLVRRNATRAFAQKYARDVRHSAPLFDTRRWGVSLVAAARAAWELRHAHGYAASMHIIVAREVA